MSVGTRIASLANVMGDMFQLQMDIAAQGSGVKVSLCGGPCDGRDREIPCLRPTVHEFGRDGGHSVKHVYTLDETTRGDDKPVYRFSGTVDW